MDQGGGAVAEAGEATAPPRNAIPPLMAGPDPDVEDRRRDADGGDGLTEDLRVRVMGIRLAIGTGRARRVDALRHRHGAGIVAAAVIPAFRGGIAELVGPTRVPGPDPWAT